MSERKSKRVCIGAFAGAHGVKGGALIKSFTEKVENIAAYGPVGTEDGARQFTLTFVRQVKPDIGLVTAPEIKSREDAQSLKGIRLYVDRESLPPPDDDEFYLEDLVGLNVIDETGAPVGKVSAVYNFGAGDLIEIINISGVDGSQLIQFTKEIVPAVDLSNGVMTVSYDFIGAPPSDGE